MKFTISSGSIEFLTPFDAPDGLPRRRLPKRKHGGRQTTTRSKHHPFRFTSKPIYIPPRIYFEQRLTTSDGGLQR